MGAKKLNHLKKRTVTVEDLYELKSVYNPQISPDGKSVVYTVRETKKIENDYETQLFMLDLETKKTKQLTYYKGNNHSPAWSPDGRWIAFLSDRSQTVQLYLLAATGGEAEALTDCEKGVSNPVWSPYSDEIMFSTKVEEKAVRVEQNHEHPQPYEVERLLYKSDASGYLKGEYTQVAVVKLKNKEVTFLTDGPYHHSVGCWAPDANSIVFCSSRGENPDLSLTMDVFILHRDTKKLTSITAETGYFHQVSWSPDGSYIAYIGNERTYGSASMNDIYIYQVSNQKTACITAGIDLEIGDMVAGDFHFGRTAAGIMWSSKEEFYFVVSEKGSVGIYKGNVNGKLDSVLMDNAHVYGVSVVPNGEEAIVAISTFTHPGDLYSLNLKTEELVKLTNVNDSFLKHVQLTEAESFCATARDGIHIHSWVVKAAAANDVSPTILEIHGGPHLMYGHTFMFEFQVLASKGFNILFSNPRGGRGYGQAFTDAVRGDYGGMDYMDLMAVTDEAINRYSYINEDKIGVTGGSYGGFMTNWIVGSTNRFKAAVTQRSISNWTSFYGVSDIGYYFTEWELKADIYENPEKLWNHSPLRLAENVKTPLLILHSEQDYRCPIEQAEQLYVALKRKDKEVEFIRFPQSNHELSRSGKPNLRTARLKYLTSWFKRYLQQSK